MEQSKRENLGLWIGTVSTIIPGLIVSGFFPEFNILPTWSWMLIATIGAMIAGSIAASQKLIGALTGGLAGLGTLVGIVAYLTIRMNVSPSASIFRLEIAIGALLGAAPGLIAYFKWARAKDVN